MKKAAVNPKYKINFNISPNVFKCFINFVTISGVSILIEFLIQPFLLVSKLSTFHTLSKILK